METLVGDAPNVTIIRRRGGFGPTLPAAQTMAERRRRTRGAAYKGVEHLVTVAQAEALIAAGARELEWSRRGSH